VKLGKADLAARSGSVRPLPRVPSLPPIAPLAPEEQAGLRAGAVRIRGERIGGLYPRRGAAALAGAAVLRFQPVEGAATYRVEVQDRRGSVVFATETAGSPVKLPAGVLRAGRRYAWTVRTLERPGPVARGEAELVTLPEEDARAREKLRQAVVSLREDRPMALLAAVDQNLGLLLEARDELRTAIQESPGDPALGLALATLERLLLTESLGASTG
jgi:hypothetical protein